MHCLLPLPAAKSEIISREPPLAATDYLLSARPLGQLFHEMGSGSYLIWVAQPEYPVFANPRIELYPRQIWEDYIFIVLVSTIQNEFDPAVGARRDILRR